MLLFARFCLLLGLCALPADPSGLARWIAGLACMYASSTVHVAMSAVIAWHSLNDLPNPVRASPRVARLWTAVRRFNGNGVRRKKAVCDHLFVVGMYRQWQVLKRLNLLTWTQVRTMAWFLVGWEAGLRVSEVCRLSVCCWIKVMAGNVDLKIVQAKNNRWLSTASDRARLRRAVEDLAVMPSAVRFVEEIWFPFLAERGVLPWDWLARLCRDGQIRALGCRFTECSAFICDRCPPLFPTFPSKPALPTVRWMGIPVIESTCSMSMMSRSHVSKEVKVWAQSLGMEPKHFAGISFRRGGVSVAAMQKVDLELRTKQFRWLSEDTQHVYIDVSDKEKDKVGMALHKAVMSVQPKGRASTELPNIASLACVRCGDSDDSFSPMLLCDGCPAGVHMSCLRPVLHAVPEGDWFCPTCVAKGKQ